MQVGGIWLIMAFVAHVFHFVEGVEGLGFKLTMVDLKLPKLTSIFIRGRQHVIIQEEGPTRIGVALMQLIGAEGSSHHLSYFSGA
jgi:hypothetical protein